MLCNITIPHLSSKKCFSTRKLYKNKHTLKIKIKNGRN